VIIFGLGSIPSVADSDAGYGVLWLYLVFVMPIVTVVALIRSGRSAVMSRRVSGKLVAWVAVLASTALLIWWGWVMHEIFVPTGGGG